jgi:hypothetical protein
MIVYYAHVSQSAALLVPTTWSVKHQATRQCYRGGVTVTLALAIFVASALLIAVIVMGFPAVVDGAVYVAEKDDVTVNPPRHAGPKSQGEASRQVTPRFLGSLVTVALKT